jgi:hypothetical protein
MRTLRSTSSLVAAGLLAACSTTLASAFAGGFGGTSQVVTTPAEPPPAAVQSAPAPVAAATAPAPTPAASLQSRRQDINSMEVLLMQALQKGAQDLARQLKVSQPNSAFVTGTGRARGFILDGHGVFFDVDVPGMRQSVIWSAQMLELEQTRRDRLRFLAESSRDDPRRKLAEADLQQIARMMGAGPGEIVIANPTANTQIAPPDRVVGTVAPVSDSTMPQGRAPAESPAPQAVQQLRDPNELYTDSVKNALIDVMLKYSGFLRIRDNEWLTVAASDSDGPQAPGQVEETSRILISIRGSDLAAFQAGKLTREEVLKRVEVREF